MTKLFKRDLSLVFCRQNVMFYLLTVICLMMRFSREGDTVFGMALILAGLTVPGLIAYDQSRSGMREMSDQDISPLTYVKEKYVLLIIMEAIAVIAGCVLREICALLGSAPFTRVDLLIDALFSVPFVVILVSVFIPFDIRYGSRKAVILKVIAVEVLILFFSGALVNFWYWIDPYLGSRIGVYMSRVPQWFLLTELYAVTAVIACISFLICRNIVSERNFRLHEEISSGDIAKNIKVYRLSNDMTQDQLADRMFVTRQTVSNWENGKAQPDVETLMKLSDIFDTDISSLINSGKRKKEEPKRGRYILICMALLILIQITLRIKDICGKGGWILLKGGLMYYSSAVGLLTPLVFNALISMMAGALVMSVISVWLDVYAGNRRKPAGIMSLLLLVPDIVMTVRILLLYANQPVMNEYIRLSVRIIVSVILPLISGALLFLFLNKCRGKNGN
ncbi:MAG: ABC-2 transporter permease [Oscillospiraceae bacterium]|nr:ABC-2 transporter permease [Oscillospiraceae bacterium]